MVKRLLFILPAFVVALGILIISIFRTAAIRYDFSDSNGVKEHNERVLGAADIDIKYNLAYPGKILPDSPLWPVKALRDRVWLLITTSPSRQAELRLLFADKRVASSKILFEKGKNEVAFSTLTKAEKYLEEASIQEIENRKSGIDTTDFLRTIALSALKHRQVIEEIQEIVPEDVRPKVIQTKNYSKNVYEKAMHALNEKGMEVPESPFEGD